MIRKTWPFAPCLFYAPLGVVRICPCLSAFYVRGRSILESRICAKLKPPLYSSVRCRCAKSARTRDSGKEQEHGCLARSGCDRRRLPAWLYCDGLLHCAAV